MAKIKIAKIPKIKVDPVTLDSIEGGLKNARHEMDAVLFRTAMSPVIREQHDEFPMITDPKGRMVVGQFGSYINEMMETWDDTVEEGDVILTSDPYKCGGAISHINDWMVLVPIFFDGELVGIEEADGLSAGEAVGPAGEPRRHEGLALVGPTAGEKAIASDVGTGQIDEGIRTIGQVSPALGSAGIPALDTHALRHVGNSPWRAAEHNHFMAVSN